MEQTTKKISKNSFDLIKIGSASVKGKWVKALLGALAYIAPLALIFLIPYAGWAIDIALFGFLTTGIIKYYKDLLSGNDAKIKDIYTQTENFSQNIFLGITLILLTLLGTILVLIPALFVIGYWSMSLFVILDEKNPSVTEAMKSCAKKMKGNVTTLLSYKIIFYLFYVVLVGIMVIITLLLAKLYATQVAVSIIIFILSYLVFIFLMSLNTIYFQSTNQVFYEEIIDGYNKKQITKNNINLVETKHDATDAKIETKNIATTTVETKPVVSKAKASSTNPAVAKATTTVETKPVVSKTKASSTNPAVAKATTTVETKPVVSKAKASSTKPAVAKASSTKPAVAKATTTKTDKK